jgi:hypothetical protein
MTEEFEFVFHRNYAEEMRQKAREEYQRTLRIRLPGGYRDIHYHTPWDVWSHHEFTHPDRAGVPVEFTVYKSASELKVTIPGQGSLIYQNNYRMEYAPYQIGKALTAQYALINKFSQRERWDLHLDVSEVSRQRLRLTKSLTIQLCSFLDGSGAYLAMDEEDGSAISDAFSGPVTREQILEYITHYLYSTDEE